MAEVPVVETQDAGAIGRAEAAGALLVCPVSKMRLEPRLDAPDAGVLVRADRRFAFRVEAGVPHLLATEAVAADGESRLAAAGAPQYAEAGAEFGFYNAVAERRAGQAADSGLWKAAIAPVLALSAGERARFPDPAAAWCDSLYEHQAQHDAYLRLAPLAGKRVLQMGGTGVHALKFLLAGAAEAWLVTPMHNEASLTRQMARSLGLERDLHAVVGIGEELPFAEASFDGIYAGGCLHHMLVSAAAREARRVLVPGGILVAVDPWDAPLHRLGTALLGKRESGVHCRPMNASRWEELRAVFPDAQCRRYGAVLRYPLLGGQKFHLNLPDPWVRAAMEWDERLCGGWPRLRRLASVSMITARREQCPLQ